MIITQSVVPSALSLTLKSKMLSLAKILKSSQLIKINIWIAIICKLLREKHTRIIEEYITTQWMHAQGHK